jgi:hypothetical protein
MSSPVTKPGAMPMNREELAARHKSLERGMASFKPRDMVNGLSSALRVFEDASRVEREQLLRSTHIAVRDVTPSFTWFAERYDHLLQLARGAVGKVFEAPDTDAGQRAQICALVMLLTAQSIKWKRIAGLRPDAAAREWMHQVFRTAVAFAVDAKVISVRVEEQTIDATVESLYVRALLIDRFSGGNLAGKRLEVLDNWLVAWMSALWLTRAAVDGEICLGVNTQNAQRGLVPHVAGDGAHLFLSLKPLQRQLDRAIREFHHGRVFPGWGMGLSAPMEDHAALIEFLERELALIEAGAGMGAAGKAARGKRVSLGANQVVGVYFGFKEICEMAFSSARLHSFAGGGAEIGVRNAVSLVDVSEGGIGLDMTDDDARRVSVGELVAVRIEKGKPCLLGVVVRKSALQKPSATLVGVKILSRSPVYTAMDRVDPATNTWQATEGILICGPAADGFADSVLIAEANYTANAPLAVTLGNETFVLSLRRIREQGKGWRMAAFDAERAA